MEQTLLLSLHGGQKIELPALSLLLPLVQRLEMVLPTQSSATTISNWVVDKDGFPHLVCACAVAESSMVVVSIHLLLLVGAPQLIFSGITVQVTQAPLLPLSTEQE